MRPHKIPIGNDFLLQQHAITRQYNPLLFTGQSGMHESKKMNVRLNISAIIEDRHNCNVLMLVDTFWQH